MTDSYGINYFTNNKFKFRSPGIVSEYACLVGSNGVVYYNGWNVDSSCGRSSPGIVNTDIAAFFVLSSGKVYDEYFYDGYVKDSYGKF